MMNFSLLPATLADRALLRNLMSLYLYDFTEFIDEDVNEEGLFVDEHLDKYWVEPGRYPFLIRVEGKPAGFVLVRQYSPHESEQAHSIAEFFVMRKYRRHGIGRLAACQIFERFPGRWYVSQEPTNLPAQAFWRKIIASYTAGQFHEEIDPHLHGPMQVFDTPASPVSS